MILTERLPKSKAGHSRAQYSLLTGSRYLLACFLTAITECFADLLWLRTKLLAVQTMLDTTDRLYVTSSEQLTWLHVQHEQKCQRMFLAAQLHVLPKDRLMNVASCGTAYSQSIPQP